MSTQERLVLSLAGAQYMICGLLIGVVRLCTVHPELLEQKYRFIFAEAGVYLVLPRCYGFKERD